MVERSRGPTPGEFLAALFRRHGVDVDPARLEDRVLAERSGGSSTTLRTSSALGASPSQ